jgi:hypothetical protein
VADFGFATAISRADEAMTALSTVGTPMYWSPERLVGSRYGFASEVWAAGLILYELAVGHHPFADGCAKLVYERSMKSSKATLFASPGGHGGPMYSETFKDVVSRMLDPNANTRITISDILTHPLRINTQETHHGAPNINIGDAPRVDDNEAEVAAGPCLCVPQVASGSATAAGGDTPAGDADMETAPMQPQDEEGSGGDPPSIGNRNRKNRRTLLQDRSNHDEGIPVPTAVAAEDADAAVASRDADERRFPSSALELGQNAQDNRSDEVETLAPPLPRAEAAEGRVASHEPSFPQAEPEDVDASAWDDCENPRAPADPPAMPPVQGAGVDRPQTAAPPARGGITYYVHRAIATLGRWGLIPKKGRGACGVGVSADSDPDMSERAAPNLG